MLAASFTNEPVTVSNGVITKPELELEDALVVLTMLKVGSMVVVVVTVGLIVVNVTAALRPTRSSRTANITLNLPRREKDDLDMKKK
jgi:hypothetical protein